MGITKGIQKPEVKQEPNADANAAKALYSAIIAGKTTELSDDDAKAVARHNAENFGSPFLLSSDLAADMAEGVEGDVVPTKAGNIVRTRKSARAASKMGQYIAFDLGKDDVTGKNIIVNVSLRPQDAAATIDAVRANPKQTLVSVNLAAEGATAAYVANLKED